MERLGLMNRRELVSNADGVSCQLCDESTEKMVA
jgi:hypothetical protein